jgi:2',3'-cyclic-nucleotide 2'-phosphodiesterase (5'-nucleotidase family)
VIVLYTQENSGYLEPCGCSSNQLGGFPRRESFIKDLRKKGNVIIVDNGDITGGFGKLTRIKYKTSIEAMNLIGYDILNLGEGDLFLGTDYIMNLEKNAKFPFISANIRLNNSKPFKGYIIKKSDSLRIAFVGVISKKFEEQIKGINKNIRIEAPISSIKSIIKDLKNKADIFILLAHMDIEEASNIAKRIQLFDVIIASHREYPLMKPINIGRTMIVNNGGKGEYIGMLKISKDKKIYSDIIPMDNKIPDSPLITRILNRYEDRIAKEGFSEEKSSPVDGGIYAGTKKCGECHKKEIDIWRNSRHSRAYIDLKLKKKEKNPECLNCHTIKYGYMNKEEGIGCEGCHGVGGNHSLNPKSGYGYVSVDDCILCHDRYRSPNFNYNKYMSKIKH